MGIAFAPIEQVFADSSCAWAEATEACKILSIAQFN
jgi:hypothetical protein